MCGSCANEGALKAAFMAYRARERGQENQPQKFSEEEVSHARAMSAYDLAETVLSHYS